MKAVLPQVRQDRGLFYTCTCTCTYYYYLFKGLDVREVAHDIQLQVAKYIRDEGMINSFDTWHGTNNSYN